MKKKENILQELYKGDVLAELPLNLSLLSLPPTSSDNNKQAPRYVACTFYRAKYYRCYRFPKVISRIIDPTQE